MSIISDNLTLLEKRFPKIAHKIENFEIPPEIEIVPGKKEFPTIRVVSEGQPLYLHSLYEPMKEAEAVIGKVDKNSLVNIIYGTGMGYHIAGLLNSVHAGSDNIIIEPDINLLKVFLRTSVATSILTRNNFVIITGSLEEIRSGVREAYGPISNKLSNLSTIILPGFEKVYGHLFKQISAIITDESRLRYFQIGNSAEDTLIGLKNTFTNLEYLINNPGIELLKDKYQDIPAIIISAGPSLDKNVHLLKEVKGKALLLCADTVVRKMINLGIVPDIVLTVERDAILYEYFYEGVEVPEDLWLLCLNVTDPRTFTKFGDHSVVCTRATEPLSLWINEVMGSKGTLNCGLSVANMAFSTAQYVGANPVIFVGQDLAYSQTGEDHTSGTIYDSVKLDEGETEYVKDYNGNPIMTTHLWKKFKIWFENEISDSPNRTFIDCTEGGAYIEGTTIMTLADAIEKYMQRESFVPVSTLIEQASEFKKKTTLSQVRDRIKEMIDVISELVREVEEIVSTDINRISARLDSNAELIEFDDDLKKMGAGFNKLMLGFSTGPRTAIAFITQSVFTMTLTKMNLIGKVDNLEKMSELVRALRNYYTFLVEIADITIMMMEDALEKTKGFEGD